MITVNSVSGGKTSSYIAIHYPADYNIFALVHSNDTLLTPKDKSIVKYASDKIGQEFIGTVEADQTLYILRELEQEIGKNIIWVKGVDFDDLIVKRSAVPNKMWRFCTTEMKMVPIFHWWLSNIGEIIDMRVGFRVDEMDRATKFTDTMKYRRSQSLFGQKKFSWDEIKWRIGSFPLIDDGITIADIVRYWQDKDIKFPKSSNCVGCFWKSDQELRQNWDDHTEKIAWFARQEEKMKAQFKTELSFNDIRKIHKQTDMFYGGGSCQSEGWCMD